MLTDYRGELRGILWSLLMVAIVTIGILGLGTLTELSNIGILYLIPVVAGAARWGMVPAVVAAFAGIAAAAFFFYPPLYSFRVTDVDQAVDLLMFVFVAVVTSRLAANLKSQAELARRQEIEMRALHAFSRRLAVAHAAPDIYRAIEDHLSDVIQRKVALFGGSARRPTDSTAETSRVPERVHREVQAVMAGRSETTAGALVDDTAGNVWLVRLVSQTTPDFGVIAVELGGHKAADLDVVRQRVEAVLAEATATLERLDIARALDEARMRAETEHLREALIGSVSHELRTPLASILGAATVLSNAPALGGEKRLVELAQVIREEAERLNSDIQNLLDATRISAEGVSPHFEWAEPADIVNSAVRRCRRRAPGHPIVLEMERDLPLLYVDPVLVEQALLQVLANAAKYSPEGSEIRVAVRREDGSLVLSTADKGIGLTAEENARLGERFFRGARAAAAASGSGLGLWIANAFVIANKGRIEASSPGADRGTVMSISVPIPADQPVETEGGSDE
jgi:two-component system sensor histidine kinase KdpD